jgi:hypothetical protein
MQREAQLALAQASAMAHMEMALERHQMRLTATPSPTSQLLQRSLHKVRFEIVDCVKDRGHILKLPY